VKTHQLAAVGAVACLLVAGCGSLPAGERHASGAGRPLTVSHRPAATAAGNEKLAAGQARRLLGLTPVPPAAVLLKSVPRQLRMPAMGTPAVGSLVDRIRSWRVAMPFARAAAWLRAHRPRGLRSNGSSRASGPAGTTMIGVSYAGQDSPAWQSAELDIGVAPAGRGTSVMRADALVIWLDPSPVRDPRGGRRLRVTVAAGCPATDKNVAGVTNSGAGLTRQLLPAARPVAGLECRFYGMNGHPWHLRGATRLSPVRALRVARSMLRLPLSHTEGGWTSCPLDDASAEVIALSYPHRADVDLWVKLNGCRTVSNGYIVAAIR
jgi:hypothetical protein